MTIGALARVAGLPAHPLPALQLQARHQAPHPRPRAVRARALQRDLLACLMDGLVLGCRIPISISMPINGRWVHRPSLPLQPPTTHTNQSHRLKENFNIGVRINQTQREELGLVEQVHTKYCVYVYVYVYIVKKNMCMYIYIYRYMCVCIYMRMYVYTCVRVPVRQPDPA